MKSAWASLNQEGTVCAWCRSSPQKARLHEGLQNSEVPCVLLKTSPHTFGSIFSFCEDWLLLFWYTCGHHHLSSVHTDCQILKPNFHNPEKKKKKDSWLFACTQIHSKCIALDVASASGWLSQRCGGEGAVPCFAALFNRSSVNNIWVPQGAWEDSLKQGVGGESMVWWRRRWSL